MGTSRLAECTCIQNLFFAKDITTIVNDVKDETKIKVFNAENPEGKVNNTFSYVMTFPNLEVSDGEPYTVCTVSVQDFELNCIKGNNSPVNGPEFVDINVSERGLGNVGEVANMDQDENAGDEVEMMMKKMNRFFLILTNKRIRQLI